MLINRECISCIKLLPIAHFIVTSGNEAGIDLVFDTTLPPLIMLFLFKQFFYHNFYKKMKEVCIKLNKGNLSLRYLRG